MRSLSTHPLLSVYYYTLSLLRYIDFNYKTETTLETTQETVTLEEIMISDNSYLYQNNKIELEQLIETLKNKKDIGIVQINENNASEKAYRELIKALNNSNVKYVEKIPETSEER